MIMTAAKSPVILSPAQARLEARRIDDQGVAEPLVKNSVLIEDSLWQELLIKLNSQGTNISREFRRWAQSQVKR
jgi:hypothetical protein